MAREALLRVFAFLSRHNITQQSINFKKSLRTSLGLKKFFFLSVCYFSIFYITHDMKNSISFDHNKILFIFFPPLKFVWLIANLFQNWFSCFAADFLCLSHSKIVFFSASFFGLNFSTSFTSDCFFSFAFFCLYWQESKILGEKIEEEFLQSMQRITSRPHKQSFNLEWVLIASTLSSSTYHLSLSIYTFYRPHALATATRIQPVRKQRRDWPGWEMKIIHTDAEFSAMAFLIWCSNKATSWTQNFHRVYL